MSQSQNRDNLERQFNNLRYHWKEKQQEDFELIKNQDGPSTLKIIYRQIFFTTAFKTLLTRKLRLVEIQKCLKNSKLRKVYFHFLNAQKWLPYNHGKKVCQIITLFQQLSRLKRNHQKLNNCRQIKIFTLRRKRQLNSRDN